MLSKIICVLGFFFMAFATNAQFIKLTKNGTMTTKKLKLPKAIQIEYRKDSSLIYFSGKAFKYEFPYLFIVKRKDTLVVDVRRVERISFISPYSYVNYLMAFIPTVLTVGLASEALFGNYYTHTIQYDELLFSLYPGAMSFLLINGTFKNLNTKTEWSFY